MFHVYGWVVGGGDVCGIFVNNFQTTDYLHNIGTKASHHAPQKLNLEWQAGMLHAHHRYQTKNKLGTSNPPHE